MLQFLASEKQVIILKAKARFLAGRMQLEEVLEEDPVGVGVVLDSSANSG